MTLKKKQSDSDFVKSLPSHPGKEFEMQRRLDNLRGINRKNNNNNNNNDNNNNRGNSNIFDGGEIPSLPKLENFIDGGVSPFNTSAQNSAIIAQQNADRLAKERQRELSNIPKATVKTGMLNLFDGLYKPSAPTLNLLDDIGSWPSPPPQPPSAGVATKSLFNTEKKTKT